VILGLSPWRRLLGGLIAIVLGGLGAGGLLIAIEARAQSPDEAPGAGVATADPAWLALIAGDRQLSGGAGLEEPQVGGLSLHVLLDDAAVSGFAPTGLPVLVAFQRGQSAHSITNLTPQFTEYGWLFTGFFAEVRYSTPGGFLPGDLLTVTQGAQSLTLTVQALSARAIALTDTVTGIAAPNAALTAYLYPALQPGQTFTATAVADSSGAFQAPITQGISAGDQGLVRMPMDAARSLSTRLIAPQIFVQVGGEGVSGITAPNHPVTIRVYSNGALKAGPVIATGGMEGFFGHCLGLCEGRAEDPQLEPGDLVEIDTLGQTLTTTVPLLTADPDLGSGQVTGQAAPTAQVSVTRWPGPLSQYGGAWSIVFDPAQAVTAGGDGLYTATVQLQPKDYGIVVTHDSEGHLGYVPFTLPYLRMQLGDVGYFAPILGGQVSLGQTALTVTVQGPSGYLKHQTTQRSTWLGGFDLYADPISMTSPEFLLGVGDVVTVETAVGVEAVVAIPEFTVEADADAQRITGRAPAGATLALHLDGVDPVTQYPYGYDTQVVVDAAGDYALELTDVSLGDSSKGLARLTTDAGHDIYRTFGMAQACLPGVWSIVVGGNNVHYIVKYLPLSSCDGPLTVSLLDSLGVEKDKVVHQNINYLYDESTIFEDDEGVPIRILPGDRLRLVADGQSREWTIPALTVDVDVAGSLVSGEAPPGAEVAVTVDDLFDTLYAPRVSATATVSSGGTFELPLALRTGDRVEAMVIGSRSTRFVAYAVVPGVMVPLFQNHLTAILPPLDAFTLTLQSARPIPQGAFTGRASDQGVIHNGQPPVFGTPWGDIRPGDRLMIQAGALSREIQAPDFAAYLDPTTRRITGTAPAGRPVWIELAFPGSHVSTTSTVTGTFELTLPPGASLDELIPVRTELAGGDVVVREVAALRWAVNLSSNCVDVRFPMAVDQAVFEVWSPGGAVKATQTIVHQGYPLMSWSGCLEPVPQAGPIESGDRLVLATFQGDWTYTVPELTAAHDPTRRVVVGRGPAGATLLFTPQFIIMPWQFPRGRLVPVDGAGGYGFDISDVKWRPGQVATIAYRDAIGNVVMRSIYLVGYQQWLPFVGHP